jgi:rubrerythrin
MTTDMKIDALKNALLLERRAHVFYSSIAGQAKDADVASVFSHMADEEASHAMFIETQIQSLQETGNFADLSKHTAALETVLDAHTRVKIIAAGYEAAAISAAMALEEKAVAFYSGQAAETDDKEGKDFYTWLAKWETQHLEWLAEMDKRLREEIWNDNSFWPF